MKTEKFHIARYFSEFWQLILPPPLPLLSIRALLSFLTRTAKQVSDPFLDHFTFSTSLVALVIWPKLVTEIHSKFVDESSMSRATPRISIRGRETRVSGLATGKSMDSWNKSMRSDTADKRSSNGMSFSDSRPEASLENNNSKTPLSEEEESKPEEIFSVWSTR